MPNINDTYASLLSAYSGSVNDKRSELLASILGYTKALSLNDMESAVLASLGYTGALNDAWDKYIRDLGGLGFSAKSDYLSSTFYGFYGSSGSLRNLLTRTEEFDNAAWVKSDASISNNTTVAPNGTTTADKVIANTISIVHLVQNPGISGSGTHTMSVYAKANGYNRISIRECNVTGNGALFDLAAGTVVTTVNATATITPAGNGWYRCTAAITWGTAYAFGILVGDNTATSLFPIFAGDGTSGILIWGAQLEANSTATTYQKVVA